MSVIKYQTGAEDNLRLNYHLLLLSRRNTVRIPYFSAITHHNYAVPAKTESRKAFLLQHRYAGYARYCLPSYVRYNYEMSFPNGPIDNAAHHGHWSLDISEIIDARCERNIQKSQEQTYVAK
jgi:hypothetical protein